MDRITVNLVPRSATALERTVAVTGSSKTDAINKAVQVYAYLEEVLSAGGSVYVREPGEETAILKFF